MQSQPFDVRTLSPDAQITLAAYIHTLTEGNYEGGIPAAKDDTIKHLRKNGYSDEVISAALAHAEQLADEAWKKKHEQSSN